MPSFSDSIFLFVLALLLFGPKKLPMLARELGKWMGEFRRASNEFKMQMEEELRLSEQEERNQKIAAMEAAAPAAPVISPVDEIPEPEHPHLPRYEAEHTIAAPTDAATEADPARLASGDVGPHVVPAPSTPPAPLPIATSGDISMMPPSTGLPTPRARANPSLTDVFNSIPAAGAATPADTAAPGEAQPLASSEAKTLTPSESETLTPSEAETLTHG